MAHVRSHTRRACTRETGQDDSPANARNPSNVREKDSQDDNSGWGGLVLAWPGLVLTSRRYVAYPGLALFWRGLGVWRGLAWPGLVLALPGYMARTGRTHQARTGRAAPYPS